MIPLTKTAYSVAVAPPAAAITSAKLIPIGTVNVEGCFTAPATEMHFVVTGIPSEA